MGETPVNTVIPVDLVWKDEGWKVEFPGPNRGSFTVVGGDSDTINWFLREGPNGAAISAITFAKSTPGNLPWVGEISTNEDHTMWTTNDTNDLPQGQNQEQWAYTVAVLFARVQYQSDPEITNTAPPPTW